MDRCIHPGCRNLGEKLGECLGCWPGGRDDLCHAPLIFCPVHRDEASKDALHQFGPSVHEYVPSLYAEAAV